MNQGRKTILVTGLDGFIGTRLAALAPPGLTFVGGGRKFLDITNKSDVERAIGRDDIFAVLHLAAKTHIDVCEKDRKKGKKSDTWRINAEGSKNIALACKKSGKYVLMLSTECVFDGKKETYAENDTPNPINWYGATKLAAEDAVAGTLTRYCILRSVLTYGHPTPYPFDIVRTMEEKLRKNEKISAVTDQRIAITFVDDLVGVIIRLMEKEETGLYHFAGDEGYSPYDMAQMIAQTFHFPVSLIRKVTMSQYFGNRAKFRLSNSVLSSKSLTSQMRIKPSSFREFLAKHTV